MSSTFKSEEEIKNELKINSWRELSEEKFIQYLKFSPNIDKEIHLKILEQVPNLSKFATEITKGAISVAEQNKETTTEMIDILKMIINTLTELSQKELLSNEERKYLVDKIYSNC